MPVYILIYLSSRSRHTSFSRDWSSDVCSSDLAASVDAHAASQEGDAEKTGYEEYDEPATYEVNIGDTLRYRNGIFVIERINRNRSEERRVGKECRGHGVAHVARECGWLQMRVD